MKHTKQMFYAEQTSCFVYVFLLFPDVWKWTSLCHQWGLEHPEEQLDPGPSNTALQM